ncbi:MAG: SRPBCC family protein [Armatimonadota bacterium]|nr:SRPBCC family protein [Armatimonadota bacterium]MDR5704365.1 SRPBCC family protein [Armatimonadota bacterium]MDR7435258.1 SRPBCC family protein [Armatimonadota bacterium]
MEASTVIHAPIDVVYSRAKDVESFPEFMPDLISVRILERSGPNTVSEWVGSVEGRRIRWVEEDEWDDAQRICRFRQREGDFDRYEGIWTFEEVPGGTKTAISVDFELDIPIIGALLSTLLRAKMRENVERMLQALKGELEGRRDQRTNSTGRAVDESSRG